MARRDTERGAAVLDAKGLRALAHPVRGQLVGLLRKYGPSTATRLAGRLGVNPGTASYHLRQLGAAGFVEEDAERANARERWWRSVHQSTCFNDPDLAAREPEAAPEAAALREELRAVVTRYRRVTPGEAAEAPEGAERVSAITHILPELRALSVSSGHAGPGEVTGSETS
ncbi:winged helix-turn-helix domain-containing protein [Streptomyces chattanoogensis]|uniref:ArsR family transcriptional regulator n=1 Tax=Streptomyces chattanoogensis TaxID=66876 RepID=A0A0N0H3U0_9ACTN|nr:winged helix-turn-helix domain-containing protein [Streptomyces chattanoogensis]KPC66541.1 ArsR family transcriptional regulator [Streptomyces chattanoogensis]